MNSAQVLQTITALKGLIELARSAGIDVAAVTRRIEAARAEGRDLNDEELLELCEGAQDSIDSAANA